jgi:Lrp/AsnC family leucine-responsive transcriptional regulator
MKLDAFDRKILVALQRDGRLSNVQLAEEIGLSPSPCLRRVRMLEEAGVIRGYQAVLDRDEVGLGLTIFVGVKVERHNDERAEAFRQAVTALPQVISAFLVSGESDFLLQVVVPDLRAYDRFVTGQLLKLPGISDIRSNFAINTVKTPGELPLGHLPGS